MEVLFNMRYIDSKSKEGNSNAVKVGWDDTKLLFVLHLDTDSESNILFS